MKRMTDKQKRMKYRRERAEYHALRQLQGIMNNEHRFHLARAIRMGLYPGLDPTRDDCGESLMSAFLKTMRDREPKTADAVQARIRHEVEQVPWMKGVRCDVGRTWMDTFSYHPTTSYMTVKLMLERVIDAYLSDP